MKMMTLVIAGAMLAGTVAQAYPYYDRSYDRSYDRGYHRGYRHHGGYDGDVAVGIACAPEVLEGNVKATDRTLATLAAAPDFAKATTFKGQVQRIAAIQAPDQRAAEYFKMIGIDSSNKEAVAGFIGARDVNSQSLVELERAAGLTEVQANKVATALQSALRGNLQ